MQTEIIFEQNDVFIHGQFDSTIFGKIQILKTNSNYDSEFVWMPDPPKTEIKEEKIEIEIEIEKENEKEQNTNEQETEKEKEQEKEKEKEKEKEVQKKEEEEKEKTQQTKNSLSGIIKRKIIDLTSFEILALNENESCMILNDTNSIDYPPFNFLSKEGLSDLLNFLLGEMLIRKSTKNENLYYPNKPVKKTNMMEVIEKERNKVRVKTFTEEEHLKLLEYFQDIRINTVKAMKKNQVNIEIFDQSVLNSLLDKDGKIIDENLFKAIVMFKPIEKTIRPIIWKYILGFYKFDSTSEENEMISQQGEKKYDIIKNQWQTFDEVQIANNKKFQKTVTQIDKDITRTDRKVSIFQDENSEGIQILRRILISHGIYNFDLGWEFQKDQKTINKKIEMIKFICRKLDPELYLSINDSKYDSDNFLFCYRWILVNFKREYKYEIVLQLWDKMFCNYLTSHLEVFMVFALLKLNRTKIVDQNLNFSEIMYVMNQFVRKKSYKVIVDESIQAVYNLATLIEDDIEKRERERLLEIEKKKMEELLREKLKIEEENRNIQENENQNEENENIKENEIKKGNDDEKEIKIINQESNIDQNTENCDEKNEVNENENTKNGNIQENENENEINENTQENKNENDKKNEDEKEIKIINQESNIGQDTENCDEKNEENENENTENGNIQENENGNEKNENIKENEIKKGNDDEKKSIQK